MPSGVVDPAGPDDAGNATPEEDAQLAKDVGWLERNAGKADPAQTRSVLDRINKNVDRVKARNEQAKGKGGGKGKK